MNIGASNRTIYDNCAHQQEVYKSTSPFKYAMYQGKYENCNKCLKDNKFWTPYQLVDIESELKNITKPFSHCAQFKYRPNCKTSHMCLSTYDKNVPVVLAPEICPIVYNNIPHVTYKGYHAPLQQVFKANQ